MIEAKIKAIVPWFGGKRTLAPRVVEQLGKHAQYFEPFCGSCAVLFAKPPSCQETVNDLHGDLVNVLLCRQESAIAESIYNRMQRSVVSDALLSEALCRLRSLEPRKPPYEERAFWYLVVSWMNRNGVAGLRRTDFQLAVRWTAGGGSPATRWRSATESLPAWHQRLQNVVVLSRDALEIIARISDDRGTAIYVDPPYMPETRTGGEYLHDFDDSHLFGSQHEQLRRVLKRFDRARVVVSYYDCPRVRQLYAGWTFIDCSMAKNLHSQNGRGQRRKTAPEVLIVNGEAY